MPSKLEYFLKIIVLTTLGEKSLLYLANYGQKWILFFGKILLTYGGYPKNHIKIY